MAAKHPAEMSDLIVADTHSSQSVIQFSSNLQIRYFAASLITLQLERPGYSQNPKTAASDFVEPRIQTERSTTWEAIARCFCVVFSVRMCVLLGLATQESKVSPGSDNS